MQDFNNVNNMGKVFMINPEFWILRMTFHRKAS